MRPGYRAMLVDRVSSHPICSLRFVTNYTPCQATISNGVLWYRYQGASWMVYPGGISYRCLTNVYHLDKSGLRVVGQNGNIVYSYGTLAMSLYLPLMQFLATIERQKLAIQIEASATIHKFFRITDDENPFVLISQVLDIIKQITG